MTDIERIIEQEQRRLDELSRPEIWERYTKNMESGELRDFTQSFRDSQTIVAALRRTAEHDKAESDGRLVVPPCKAGDKIYNTASFFSALKEPEEHIVEGFTFWHGEMTILCKDGYRTFGNKIGKTVFLARAEAEAALGGGGDGV